MLREPIESMKYLIDKNLPITDLLNPDYCYVDDTLAKYYDLPLLDKTGYVARPQVAGNHRGGIPSSAFFLFMTSRGDRTSPVERGVYLLRNVLFTPPPPAPPNVPDLLTSTQEILDNRFDLKKLNLSKSRQLLLFHTKRPQCNSCHRNIDPLGFALEGFDHFGSWRGETIDLTGELPSGDVIVGANGLKNYLESQKEAFVKGFIRTLMSYALHRPTSFIDEDEVNRIYELNKPSEFRTQDIIKSIVTSKYFGET
jgi:hypothetical protein